MKAVALVVGVLLASPALADSSPAASGVHDVPPLSQFTDIITWISASPAPGPGNPCALKVSMDRELEMRLAADLMDAGFPNAAPAPIYTDPPSTSSQVPLKPVFGVEATTKIRDVNSSHPTCLLAMRARVALGREQRLVLWSSPLVILEADARSDPGKPSADLQETFKKMSHKMARVFVLAWRGVKAPMEIPE